MHHDRSCEFARARNLALDGQVPDWIELLPAGPDIIGADGRAWTLPDPQSLVTAFAQRNSALVVDWEHASEHRAPHGLDAPAAGWIDQIEVRDGGAVWGHVAWTDKAAAQIAAREYRYLSPVFTYEKAGSRIVALVSVGLTNQPNLSLTALNQQGTPMNDDLLERLRYLLNLPTLATVEEVIAELDKLRTQLAAAPTDTAGNRLSLSALLATAINRTEVQPLEKFVPRADYDATLIRATNAEQQLQALRAEQRKEQVDALIAKALSAGQITPATQDYYRAMCQTETGVAEFEKFLALAPAVIGGSPKLDGKPPGTDVAMNAEMQQVSAMFGNNIEDLKKYGGLQ